MFDKKFLLVIVILIVLALAAMFCMDRAAGVQAASSDSEISAKLDQVLQGIADIKNELRIIKVRVSQIQ